MANDSNGLTYRYFRDDGKIWALHGHHMEVPGIHHSAFGGFLSLPIGLYCAGKDSVRLRDFVYRALGSQ